MEPSNESFPHTRRQFILFLVILEEPIKLQRERFQVSLHILESGCVLCEWDAVFENCLENAWPLSHPCFVPSLSDMAGMLNKSGIRIDPQAISDTAAGQSHTPHHRLAPNQFAHHILLSGYLPFQAENGMVK